MHPSYQTSPPPPPSSPSFTVQPSIRLLLLLPWHPNRSPPLTPLTPLHHRYSVALGITGSVLQSSLYTVDGGERAIMYDRISGVLDTPISEGTHFRMPWFQTPNIMDIRMRPRTISSVTGTKDLQMVNISLRVLSKPDVNVLSRIYRNLGTDFDERVLPSIGNEVLKAVVAQYQAEQLLTQRASVSAAVRSELTKRAAEFNILIDDVAITHLSFGTEFTKAVEAKQVAQQEAERMRFVVMKSDQERKAAVVRAEGESEAARLISDATRSAGSGLIELRRIEAAKDIAGQMSKSRNVVYLPGGGAGGGGNVLLGLNNT